MIAQKKKWMSVLLMVMVILTSGITVYAAPNPPETQAKVQPYWSNTFDMSVWLSIDDGKAMFDASVTGYSGVTKITAKAVLERINSDGSTVEIDRWDNISSDSRFLDWGSTRYVAKGYTYRLTFTATVYKNGVGEVVSGSKSAQA